MVYVYRAHTCTLAPKNNNSIRKESVLFVIVKRHAKFSTLLNLSDFSQLQLFYHVKNDSLSKDSPDENKRATRTKFTDIFVTLFHHSSNIQSRSVNFYKNIYLNRFVVTICYRMRLLFCFTQSAKAAKHSLTSILNALVRLQTMKANWFRVPFFT